MTFADVYPKKNKEEKRIQECRNFMLFMVWYLSDYHIIIVTVSLILSFTDLDFSCVMFKNVNVGNKFKMKWIITQIFWILVEKEINIRRLFIFILPMIHRRTIITCLTDISANSFKMIQLNGSTSLCGWNLLSCAITFVFSSRLPMRMI